MSHIFSAYDRVYIFWRPSWCHPYALTPYTYRLRAKSALRNGMTCVGCQSIGMTCMRWHPTHIASGPSMHWEIYLPVSPLQASQVEFLKNPLPDHFVQLIEWRARIREYTHTHTHTHTHINTRGRHRQVYFPVQVMCVCVCVCVCVWQHRERVFVSQCTCKRAR